MTERTEDLSRRLAVARGDQPADVVLRGGRVLSVFTGELIDADVAIAGEHVAGAGRYREGLETVDVSVAEVACPIGGLLSDRPVEEVAAAVRRLEEAARELGTTLPSPFMAMSFLALSVIPELKLTDRGLVDTVSFELVPLHV